MQNRMIDRPDLQLDRPGVEKRLGQRDLGPMEAGLPMSTVEVSGAWP